MTQTENEMYWDRLKRIEDAVKLKTPDRVPILASFRYFAAKYTGLPFQSAFYDVKKWLDANKKTILDFGPDMYYGPYVQSGPALDILGLRQLIWPGHGLPANISHQFIEQEYVKADEYKAMLDDLSNFAIRTYLPRICEALEPLKTLPALNSLLFGYSGLSLLTYLVRPEIQKALEAMVSAGREYSKIKPLVDSFEGEMAKLGFPAVGPVALTAFDSISDYLRGMRGSMLDMFRQPDKLLRAIEILEPIIKDRAIEAFKRSGNPRIRIPLHRGADGFMSDKQFRTFYWPSLKGLLLALIEEGITPVPFFEGSFESRLEYLNELPKGKILARFDSTDLLRAKEIIGHTVCICGNVPISLLKAGTADEVRSYCKKLIDVVGKDGGFIMCTRSVMDDARPENVSVWFDFTREYGVYR